MPPFRSTPLSEFDNSLPLLCLTFPTLFPRGEAHFIAPRIRAIKYKEYVQHLMKYKDGRFAKHPRFRYVVFNTMMRHSINDRASFTYDALSRLLNG